MEFRGEVWARGINLGIICTEGGFKAVGLGEITSETGVGREEKGSQDFTLRPINI